ncbi:MAG: hypothetical protein IT289_05170 [Oligoflexia bacterium]|nr:hypothetical protein [Oligoflexia bacterium]
MSFNKSVNLERVVNKLNAMMFNRFGVHIEYFGLSDACEKNKSVLETAKRNSGAPMIVSHNHVIVPIRVEGTLVGATQARGTRVLKPFELSQVVETVDLVLTAALTTQSKLDTTDMLLGNMMAQENLSNVIGFARRKAQAIHSA